MKTYCPATDPPHMVRVSPIPGTMRYDPSDLICEEHGRPLKTKGELAPRKALRQVSEKRSQEPRKGSTLRRGKGFAASPAQRKKVRNQPCVVCGQCSGFDIGEGGGSFVVDPAHLWPRGSGGCDSPDCVVALCRGHHRAFDEGKLDILPALISRGCWTEMAHPIAAHEVSLTQLLERLTSEKWIPASQRLAA